MTRRQTVVRLVLAVLLLVASIGFWLWRPSPGISEQEADEAATHVFRYYLARSGQPRGHFEKPARVRKRKGWEYRWRFVPCPDEAAFRLRITAEGGAKLLELPACDRRPGERDKTYIRFHIGPFTRALQSYQT